MADEHTPTHSPAPQPDAGQSPKEQSGDSKLMRFIIWGLVGVFAIVALVDIASRQGFSKSLANLEEGIDTAEEPITLADFEKKYKSGLAIKTQGNREGLPTILYKWPSLFRQYEIHLTVESGEENVLATYSANDGPAALIGRPGSGEDPDSMLDEGDGPGDGEPAGGGPEDGREVKSLEDEDNPEK